MAAAVVLWCEHSPDGGIRYGASLGCQKTLKSKILRVFPMSDFIKEIIGKKDTP